jgi:hypothetical protein
VLPPAELEAQLSMEEDSLHSLLPDIHVPDISELEL